MINEEKIRCLAIIGPTSTGKTGISIKLAKKFNGEIVSVDSRQLYKEMNIGTAKPDEEEMDGVPHHFISEFDPEKEINVWDFTELAAEKIRDINNRKKLAVITGGTGLYYQALRDGLGELPEKDHEFRKRLRNISSKHRGPEKIFGLLKKIDPDRAEVLSVNDHVRVERALEIFHVTGIPMSKHDLHIRKPLIQLNILTIALTLERKFLYNLINQRVDKMVEMGLFEEVKKLMDRYENTNGLITLNNTIGYKEIISYFKGEYDRETAIELVKRNTRRYAKRQLTWFRKQSDINWFDSLNDYDEIEKSVEKFLRDTGGGFICEN